jgi:hypothetical protein
MMAAGAPDHSKGGPQYSLRRLRGPSCGPLAPYAGDVFSRRVLRKCRVVNLDLTLHV